MCSGCLPLCQARTSASLRVHCVSLVGGCRVRPPALHWGNCLASCGHTLLPRLTCMLLWWPWAAGTVPPKWPMMFPSLRYLHLQWNDLYLLDSTYRVPSLLPTAWFRTSERGFPSLSVLTLYPGNEYLCSVPDADLILQDINPCEGRPRPAPAMEVLLAGA